MVRDRPTAEEAVERLVELARQATPKHFTAQEWAGVHRLERALLAAKGSRGRALGVAVAAAAALAAAALIVALRLRERPLTYEVTNARVSEEGYVATTDAEAGLRFSDRSELGVAPGTRVRVSRLEVHGARVMLEGGTLHVRIHPEPHAAWTLDAGPYVVHVTGTEFDLGWRVDDQTLDLRLHKGSVIVDGPLADAGVRVSAGQHLVANGNAGTLSLVDEGSGHARAEDASLAAAGPASSEIATASGPPAPVDAPSSSGPRDLASPRRPHAGSPSWSARVAHGDFDGVIADAERRGIDKTLGESPIAELAALADASRYARRQDLARRALMAQRARYPGSVQARDASFFLGGLADDAASVDWYDVYLGENPGGAYASQALGRKMILVERLRGPESARTIASEYVARFPDGPYAGAANKLLHAR